jgi:hypothetical protein
VTIHQALTLCALLVSLPPHPPNQAQLTISKLVINGNRLDEARAAYELGDVLCNCPFLKVRAKTWEGWIDTGPKVRAGIVGGD